MLITMRLRKYGEFLMFVAGGTCAQSSRNRIGVEQAASANQPGEHDASIAVRGRNHAGARALSCVFRVNHVQYPPSYSPDR